MRKELEMQKPSAQASGPSKRGTSTVSRVPEAPARSTRVAALLSVVAVLGSAVLIAAMSGPKLPKSTGE